MKFLLQVRFNGADNVIGELPAGEQQKVTAEFEAIRQSPGVLDGNQPRSHRQLPQHPLTRPCRHGSGGSPGAVACPAGLAGAETSTPPRSPGRRTMDRSAARSLQPRSTDTGVQCGGQGASRSGCPGSGRH
jgi:hypothetical protein